jgi:polysaccharide deacetylase family protein (PEP-CTERM system associated)
MKAFTVDVEDWFNILDSPSVPHIEQWDGLESRLERNLEKLLDVFAQNNIRTTMFWLGWMAERNKALVIKCQRAGHEIASHGYGHMLAFQVTPERFLEDISHAKSLLEDITGKRVDGFRAPGYGITEKAPWAFDVIKEAGYLYDSSVFPTEHGHGGMANVPLSPYIISTKSGILFEIGISVVAYSRFRFCLFGGGYLRLAPKYIIHLGIKHLEMNGRPLIVYVHPREIDPDHPRLSLSPFRRFKSYVNLKSTMSKIKWLCENNEFCTMKELLELTNIYKTAGN